MESVIITLVRVMRGQNKVEDKPEDIFEKIIGTEACAEEVIESDEYGKAVFQAVDDNMDEEDFTSEII